MKKSKIAEIAAKLLTEDGTPVQLVRNTYKRAAMSKTVFTSSAVAVPFFRSLWLAQDEELDYVESFKVAFLSRANRLLAVMNVSTGGTSTTVVDAKVIMQAALLVNASGIILAHNHPSGQLRPSPEDDRLTRQLADGAKLLGMRVVEHIILTSEHYYSYADERRL